MRDIHLAVSSKKYSCFPHCNFDDLADNVEDQDELELVDGPPVLVIDLPIDLWDDLDSVYFFTEVGENQLEEAKRKECDCLES